jgi:hypothetical protein
MSTIQAGEHSASAELLEDPLDPFPVRGYIHVARPVALSKNSSSYCSRVPNGSVTVTSPS